MSNRIPQNRVKLLIFHHCGPTARGAIFPVQIPAIRCVASPQRDHHLSIDLQRWLLAWFCVTREARRVFLSQTSSARTHVPMATRTILPAAEMVSLYRIVPHVGQRGNSLSISASDLIPQNRVRSLIFRQCGSTARGTKLSSVLCGVLEGDPAKAALPECRSANSEMWT